MIVEPSVTELLEVVENRFELVTAIAKRARQLGAGSESRTEVTSESNITVAANEMIEGKLWVEKE